MDIYNKPIGKEVEEALLGDLTQLWEVVSSLEGDSRFNKALKEVKFGIDVEFDIRSIIEECFEMKPAHGIVTIERKLDIDITEYRDEIDKRKKIMKDILRDCYQEGFDGQEEGHIKGYEDG